MPITITSKSTYEEVRDFVLSFFIDFLINENYEKKFHLHPLGFYYSRIFNSENEQLRIHIWNKNYKQKDDLYIHDHYYDLNSWILLGKIKDTLYDVSIKENCGELILYQGSYNDDENYRYLNPSNLFCNILNKEERIFSKGESYFIKKNQYHSNEIIFENSEYTCTLVLTQNPNIIHSPNVLGKLKQDKIIEEVPTLIEYTDMKLIIDSIINKI